MEGNLRAIFISYRRDDSEGEAGRLFDELIGRFNEKAVFMDVAAIEPGRDFRKAIHESIDACSVLLAVIGQEWLDSTDAQGQRRLNDADDSVRLEIASALRRDIPVIPILVRGAKMPVPERLPDDVKELAYRNAIELTHARWKSDVQILLIALSPYLEHACTPPVAAERKALQESTASLQPEWVSGIGRELARYIGPIADIVVKRAARRSSSPTDFCLQLAEEIESRTDRDQFLAFCRRL